MFSFICFYFLLKTYPGRLAQYSKHFNDSEVSTQTYFEPQKIVTLPILHFLTPVGIGLIKSIIKRGVFCIFQSFKERGVTNYQCILYFKGEKSRHS